MRRAADSGHAIGLVLFTAMILAPLAVSAQTTTWVGTIGDWGTPSNWSDGEPTAALDAEVATAASPRVTLAGEVCRNLTLAVSVGGATVTVASGSLDVIERIHLASSAIGIMTQSGGAVSAGELVIGDVGAGAYTLSNGTLTLASARLGRVDAGTSGSFVQSAGNSTCTITDSLVIAEAGSFQCAAGTLTVGTTATDGTWVNGVFTLNNDPTITMTAYTMSETATLSIFVGPLGAATIDVTGTATLGGTLLVTDIGASNGTYEVVVGNAIKGTFSASFLPPDWSWRVEGNSLLLTKGFVPVEESSWGHIKARFRF